MIKIYILVWIHKLDKGNKDVGQEWHQILPPAVAGSKGIVWFFGSLAN